VRVNALLDEPMIIADTEIDFNIFTTVERLRSKKADYLVEFWYEHFMVDFWS
jgi:hypothetical protein